MADELSVLPYELIMQVLKHLSPKDIARVSQCCKILYDVAHIDTLWQHLCRRDFGVVSTDGWGDQVSFHDLYTKVLHTCQHKLGLWTYSKSPYGMLIHVKLEKGQIAAHNCLPPPDEDVRGPLHCSMCLFCIVLRDDACVVQCRAGHTANLKIKDHMLSFRCDECESWARRAKEQDIVDSTADLVHTEFGDDFHHHNVFNKLYHLARTTRHWSKFKASRVPRCPQSQVSPVRFGVYKGTYGAHGLELINLTLAPTGYQLHGKKLLGDPNVPAGEISLYIDLRCPLFLTQEQQRDLVFMKNFKPEQVAEAYQVPADASQPFEQEAISFFRFDQRDVPNTCRARFMAEGRIAGHGYMNPSFSKAHFVVFTEDFFGFFWLDLHSFSLFHLAKEDLS